MNKNICERCKRNNHNKDECMSTTDINGNMIDEENENANEYINFIVKDKSIYGKLIKKLTEIKKNILKILEVPPSGAQINNSL
jgi:hypothetical protein